MRVFSFIFCVFVVLGITTSSYAQGDGGDASPGYTGPKQLTTAQMNPTGGCDCGTAIGGSDVGGLTSPETPVSSAIAFAPVLSVIVAAVIYDDRGEVEEIIYEDLIAVVELEKVGNDYYVRMFEVRRTEAAAFIAGRDKPGNIYYVMGAQEFLDNNGGSNGDIADALPAGVDIQELQVFELPPEEDYHYMFFVGAEGSYIEKYEFLAMFQ